MGFLFGKVNDTVALLVSRVNVLTRCHSAFSPLARPDRLCSVDALLRIIFVGPKSIRSPLRHEDNPLSFFFNQK